jgi:hypothetical protein
VNRPVCPAALCLCGAEVAGLTHAPGHSAPLAL